MTEVPVIFPSHVAKPKRYVVNDVNRTVRRCHSDHSEDAPSALPLLEDGANHPIHRGSASVSSLTLERCSRGQALLTTSVLVECPGILAIALSSNGKNLESPVIVEVDLASETQVYSSTIRVRAFVDSSRDGEEYIRLVLVDDNAVVLTLLLNPESLKPREDFVKVLSIRDLLKGRPAMKEAVSGAQLHKTMVDFYAPHLMIVALSPLLISVNLESDSCEVWLETQCLEDMKARRSTIGNIFSKASDLLLGKLEHGGGLVDMAPTAALCVSTTANPLLDPTYIFTLHSDGKIRRWTVGDALLPTEVTAIELVDIPNPRDWSDVYNSVYLSARLYNQVYVLAVHIQTSSTASYEDDDESHASNSNLFVVYGGQDVGIQSTVISAHTLSVPDEANSLVDMDFVPNQNSCSLMAMFRASTNDFRRNGTTLYIRYPPSVVSIIGTQPQVSPVEYFLDGVAQAERARIEALVFNDGLVTGDDSLEEELHEIDSRFMKFLFRPAYPRGSGTVVPPQKIHIHRALQKLVYGRIKRADAEDASLSIELETLKAVYEWRSKENRKRMAMSPRKRQAGDGSFPAMEASTPRTTATSVYESYVATTFDDMDEDNDYDTDDDSDEEMGDAAVDANERERGLQLELHTKLWRRLLVAIWEEEQSLRSPLSLCLLGETRPDNSGMAVLVRSGFTSIITEDQCEEQSDHGIMAQFDIAAIKLMKTIESDENNFKKLFTTEQRIWNHMAKAQLDEMTPSDFAEGYSKVVDFAFDYSTDEAAFSVQEQQQLAKSLGRISLEDSSRFLQETPKAALPGLNLFGETHFVDLNERDPSRNQEIANNQVRQAACALSVRCIDASRRLVLARYLLLSYLVRSSRVSSTAFYLYVRTLAVMWVASQEVKMPTAFKAGTRAKEALKDEPPNKRLSFGDDAASVLSNLTTTTCMDSLLVSILRTRDDFDRAFLLDFVISLSQEIFSSSLRCTIPSSADTSSGKLWKLLPELGALPPSSKPALATDYPRLALMLLAPMVALSSTKEAPNVSTARREALAECLLVESRSQIQDSAMSAMRIKACELLASSNNDFVTNEKRVKAALETLLEHAEEIPSQGKFSDTEVGILEEKLQAIIYGEEPEIRSGISRLVRLRTAQKLFAPFAYKPDIPEEVEEAAKVLSPKLLYLSDLLHRVDILEYHVVRDSTSSDLVLDFINGAIRELHDLFPPDFCKQMPEYSNLYNRLFHNAISAGEWNQAYDASVNNPSTEGKIRNFKSLVNSMVGAGALQELLDKCSSLATSSNATECVDLYGLATDALKDSCSRDLYLVRANSADATTAAPDFQGSLYALHVSRSEWRKAAQCLDARFVNAMHALANAPSGFNQDLKTAAVRDNLIVEDLVLSSVGAANAIGLVHDAAAQFIVSGEDDDLPMNGPISDDGSTAMSSKRRRNPDSSQSYTDKELHSLDRISQFTSSTDLNVRALWSIAFRSLFLDGSGDSTIAKTVLIVDGSSCVDEEALGQLYERGYYLPAILLTMAISKANTASRNRFHDALRYLLGDFLVPLSVDGSLPSSNNSSQRPSLSQLRRSLDSIENAPGQSPYFLSRRSKKLSELVKSSIQGLASSFVEKLTRLHSNAERPIALDVAGFYLDFDENIAQIPCWLSSLLLGDDVVDSSASGLFGRRPKPGSRVYLGDPSALLTLYTKHGMFLDACRVVTAVLSGKDGMESRKEKAPSRLPEKGDIDFVPYKKIDILWNLIERSLSRGDFDKSTQEELKTCRDEMVSALEQHFALMKISEMGIRSSRALSQESFLSSMY